ncbi:unnamed protein product [Mytilus edulis]|uniref:Reverse transcriptase domain-containing protein n=1 Tax=Mytilus edulis TaxID=6550 RepID=A0A8S3R2T6_MYTED|nr:unnamed protein product [Mytilus edulis]
MDLHVGDICMSGEQNVMEGFKQHFRNYETPEESTVLENRQYHQEVEYEIGLITEMVNDKNIPPATLEELQKAIKSINKGKSADIYGITVEHILHAGKHLEMLLLNLINIIFKEGKRNHCITCIKVIETIVKVRINPAVLITQNVTQRGFTAGSGPANAALPVEEIYREAKNNNQEYELVLLDAKSAFDVVIHSHLMKRLYHAGIDDKHWTSIQSMKNISNHLRIKHQSSRDSKRVSTKIKLLTGTYILQPLRYKTYKEGTEDHCIACDYKETLEHLLIECEAWNYLRDPILQTIKNLLTTNGNVREKDLTCEMTIQVLMDITKIRKIYRVTSDLMSKIEFQSKRLVFLIHNARYQLVMKDQSKKKAV